MSRFSQAVATALLRSQGSRSELLYAAVDVGGLRSAAASLCFAAQLQVSAPPSSQIASGHPLNLWHGPARNRCLGGWAPLADADQPIDGSFCSRSAKDQHASSILRAASSSGGSSRGFAALAPCEAQPERAAANELDQRLQQAMKEGGARAVLQVVQQDGERFTELNVVTALQQLAEASAQQAGEKRRARKRKELSPRDIVRSDAFQALVDMVLGGMMRFEPSLLAEAVRSCGRLGASEEMLLDEIGRHLMKFTQQLSAADIAGLVEGYASLEHSPSLVLFDSLASRATQLAASFTPEQRAAVRAGYEALGYADKAPAL